MRSFKGKNILVALGFIFFLVSSFHSIDHISLNDQSEQIECQLCNNDASQPLKNKSLESKYTLSSILIPEIKDKFISTHPQYFQSRAPPKI